MLVFCVKFIYQKLPFQKKGKKKAPSTRSFHNQNKIMILSFKKVVVYIFSIKKYDIRKWR